MALVAGHLARRDVDPGRAVVAATRTTVMLVVGPGSLTFVESRSGAVAEAPFPLPAHRTGRAVFRHPALGQELMLSPTESSWEGRSSEPVPARRAGTDRGTVTSLDSSACASPGATDGAGAARGGPRPGTRR